MTQAEMLPLSKVRFFVSGDTYTKYSPALFLTSPTLPLKEILVMEGSAIFMTAQFFLVHLYERIYLL